MIKCQPPHARLHREHEGTPSVPPPQQAKQDKIWVRRDKCKYVTCHAAAHKQGRQRTKLTNEVCRAVPTPTRPAVLCSRPKAHTPIHPLSHRTQQEGKKRTREPGPRKQARRKTETNTRAEAGKRCLPGRRAGKRRVGERVKSDETTKETGGSQQPSEGRARRRGHGKHTTSTTSQESTGEGGTRGTDDGQHHAPQHAPHRHHTHRTHPHPRPQHVASGPRQPAQRAGSQGREGA